MTSITKTITAVFLIGLFVTAMACEAKTNTKGKFHLVYLVSAEKLKVGARVFVEPLFFTNGERIVFAYNYCRQYFGGKYKIKDDYVSVSTEELLDSSQIVDDLRPIHKYCEGKDTTINVKDYIVRNSEGVRLSLNKVRFSWDKKHKRQYPHQYLLSLSRGSATIRTVRGSPHIAPEFTIKGGQQYFFLMTSDPVLLDRLAPIQKVSKEKVVRFQERVRRYTQARTTGTIRPKGMDICEMKSITTPPGQVPFRAPRKGPYKLTQAQILASLFGDFDGDNLPDLAVSIFEKYPRDKSKNKYHFYVRTTEIRFFYGNGKERCLTWDYAVAAGFHPFSLPLGLVEVGNCRYLIASLEQGAKTLNLINLSGKTQGCKNLIVYKGLGLDGG